MGEERALQPPRSDALVVLDEKMNPRQRVKPLFSWLVCAWRVSFKKIIRGRKFHFPLIIYFEVRHNFYLNNRRTL